MTLSRSTMIASAVILVSSLYNPSIAATYPEPVNEPSTPSGVYLGIFGGLGFLPENSGVEFKSPAYHGGVQFGYKTQGPARVELEVAYFNSDFDYWPGGLRTTTSMVNGFYDFDHSPIGSLTPYVGAGIGSAYIEGSGIAYGEQLVGAVQGIIGTNVSMSRNAKVFADYRYLTTTAHVLGDQRYQNNTFNLGINYLFD